MTEQLALEQQRRDRIAVHGHELPRCPRAQLVNQPPDDLLTGAGLPRDQDGNIGGSDALHDRPYLVELGAAADEGTSLAHLDVQDLLRGGHPTFPGWNARRGPLCMQSLLQALANGIVTLLHVQIYRNVANSTFAGTRPTPVSGPAPP